MPTQPTVKELQVSNLESRLTNSYSQANTAYAQANTAYARANNPFPTLNIVTSNVVTAIAAQHYVMTNANLSIVTLPATPAVSDSLMVTFTNGLMTNNIAPNGSKIAGTTDNVTINMANVTMQIRYISTAYGWMIG